MNKKYIIVATVSILILSLGVSLAYWTASLKGEGTPMSFSTGDLRIIFNKKTDGDLTSDTPIEPGWSITKTFSVKSESDTTYKYNIILKDLINTFKTTGFLQYKIISSNGYNMTDYEDVPKSETASNTPIATNISLEPNETHEYTIELIYRNSEEDQSEDMGSTLNGTIFVEEYKLKTLYTVLSDGKKYEVGTRTDFNTSFGGETITQGYNSTGKIYLAEDNYYFAGNPSDNWVKFADKWWRIIRTNSTEGTRLLYAGTSHDGQDGYINNTAYQWYGFSGGVDYVQWSYAANTIGNALTTWYNTNITGTNANMINASVAYCNDTSVARTSGSYQYFGAYDRLNTNKAPSYSCGTNSNTTHRSIGLMTADEVAFAGGLYVNRAPNTYYYRNSKTSGCTESSEDPCSVTANQSWWTMSPSYFNGTDSSANVFFVWGAGSPGNLNYHRVNYSHTVRPVITLKPSVTVSGSGTTDDPYVPSL